MLKIYFLSKIKARFESKSFQKIVNIEDKNDILTTIDQIPRTSLYLFDIDNINAIILKKILHLIDVNLFGKQLKKVFVNKNHPKIFQNFEYNFEIISDETPITICDQDDQKTQSPFIALGDCIKWDTVLTHGHYQITDGSNAAAIQKLHQIKGDIAWASASHGETVVCFDGISQLKHAIQGDMLDGWVISLK